MIEGLLVPMSLRCSMP